MGEDCDQIEKVGCCHCKHAYCSDNGINYKIFTTKFRTCNHRLPMEVSRYDNIPRLERTCICSGKFGDEFPFIYAPVHIA